MYWNCYMKSNVTYMNDPLHFNITKETIRQIFKYYYVSPSNEGRHIVLVWFLLPLPLLLSEACSDHNFFVFPDRSIIFGMWVHDHQAVRGHAGLRQGCIWRFLFLSGSKKTLLAIILAPIFSLSNLFKFTVTWLILEHLV